MNERAGRPSDDSIASIRLWPKRRPTTFMTGGGGQPSQNKKPRCVQNLLQNYATLRHHNHDPDKLDRATRCSSRHTRMNKNGIVVTGTHPRLRDLTHSFPSKPYIHGISQLLVPDENPVHRKHPYTITTRTKTTNKRQTSCRAHICLHVAHLLSRGALLMCNSLALNISQVPSRAAFPCFFPRHLYHLSRVQTR